MLMLQNRESLVMLFPRVPDLVVQSTSRPYPYPPNCNHCSLRALSLKPGCIADQPETLDGKSGSDRSAQIGPKDVARFRL